MKVKYNKEAHRVYSLIYHLIFVAKYRQKVFKEEIGIIEDFKNKCIEISKEFEVQIIEQECGQVKKELSLSVYLNIISNFGLTEYCSELINQYLSIISSSFL